MTQSNDQSLRCASPLKPPPHSETTTDRLPEASVLPPVAVITTVPAATPVTKPLELTVAVELLDDVQVYDSVVPSGEVAAVNWILADTATALSPVTVTAG